MAATASRASAEMGALRAAAASAEPADDRADDGGALEREASLRQAPPDVGEDGESLREPQRPAHDRCLHARREAPLDTGGDVDAALGVPNGRGPGGRAVHEDAVLERHAAEANLLHLCRG